MLKKERILLRKMDQRYPTKPTFHLVLRLHGIEMTKRWVQVFVDRAGVLSYHSQAFPLVCRHLICVEAYSFYPGHDPDTGKGKFTCNPRSHGESVSSTPDLRKGHAGANRALRLIKHEAASPYISVTISTCQTKTVHLCPSLRVESCVVIHYLHRETLATEATTLLDS